MSDQKPSYDDVETCLGGTKAFISPAELHGLLLGTFCAKGTDLSEEILLAQSLSDDEKMTAEQKQVLHALVESTREDLINFNFSISLLLPECDDIDKQASEFVRWCQGFLSGLGAANDQTMHDADAIEALKRIVEAANIDLSDLEISDEDEDYLFNVTEYVRLAVLAIYADLKKGHQGGATTNVSYH